ncbi:MAG TPA: class I SAM-dependent methyltransferase [Candidatus Binatia bacterium]|nr:class I SAM-dependent methyltransferase [Candidatus Binatia bacterium]
MENDFTQFEHEGWERVADKYDSIWASLTRQFVPHFVSAADVTPGMSVLDVACGPGYLCDYARNLGALPVGVDFSEKMVVIAQQMFPGIPFVHGDAQHLPFHDARFDRVLINFGLLHVANPEEACAEAARVLKSGSKFGFTVWAGPEQNPGAKIVNNAIEAHADLNVDLPQGPPHYLYGDEEECRKVLAGVGFDGPSLIFQTRSVEWTLPSASFLFEAERNAGVRTAGLLARQSPERLEAIQRAIENGVKRYPRNGRFVVPFAAHIVVVSKS